MDDQTGSVVILPCSGIGKAYGTLAREITCELVENLRPGVAVTTCLPLLVIKDPDACAMVTSHPVITLDGCPKDCARKSVEAAGGKVAVAYQSLKFFAENRHLKPEGLSQLNDTGRELAKLAAGEIAATVDRLAAGESDQ